MLRMVWLATAAYQDGRPWGYDVDTSLQRPPAYNRYLGNVRVPIRCDQNQP
jgi:hypothetical protein